MQTTIREDAPLRDRRACGDWPRYSPQILRRSPKAKLTLFSAPTENGLRSVRARRPFFTSFPRDRYTTSSCFQSDPSESRRAGVGSTRRNPRFRRQGFSGLVFVAFLL